MDMMKIREAKGFVGADFLTWLWFEAESREGVFELEEIGTVDIYPDDQLVLAAEHSEARESVLRKGTPAEGAEAGAALAVGKKVARIKWKVQSEAGDFVVTLDADDLDVRGLRIAAVPAPTAIERIIARMERLEEVYELIDALFRLFLDRRLAESWESETLPAMRAWVRRKDGDDEAS